MTKKLAFVKLTPPDEMADELDIVWLVTDRICAVKNADEEFGNSTFVYVSDAEEPFVTKGPVEQVIEMIRNAK